MTTAREEAASHIRAWCSEKGTEAFEEQLLRLLDVEFLRSSGGLSHISLPKHNQRNCDGSIPNRHWRFRFYSGCAAVLGWVERVTYGDPRYFDAGLHDAIKQL
ncbi:hypothetical protein R1sor_007641 [Riccia sorocarpa]|uniref:Uncharacterized protein n=1 Tax=Riccia sorocarpa TaxID=122646 RepID=A0ABD3HR24_9MARC